MRKPSRELISQQEAIEAVKAVYGELENRPVERDCIRRTECCQFKLTGKTPYLTAGEALVTAAALQQSLSPENQFGCFTEVVQHFFR